VGHVLIGQSAKMSGKKMTSVLLATLGDRSNDGIWNAIFDEPLNIFCVGEHRKSDY
jgi:hypothetical protein